MLMYLVFMERDKSNILHPVEHFQVKDIGTFFNWDWILAGATLYHVSNLPNLAGFLQRISSTFPN